MHTLPQRSTPDSFLRHLFNDELAREGGVVRRKALDVERVVGIEKFEREVRRRGFHAVRNGQYVLIFCNRDPIQTIV